jgi:hypothetical protein
MDRERAKLRQKLSMKAVAAVLLILQKYDANTTRSAAVSPTDLSCVSYYSTSFQLSKMFPYSALLWYFLCRKKKQGIERRNKRKKRRKE